MMPFPVQWSDGSVTATMYPARADRSLGATLVLAHGAGAGQTSGFMVQFAQALADRGLDVVTFNFLYTEQRRRVPDPPARLEACYRAVVARVSTMQPIGGRPLFIGGKSMGGRIATHIAAGPDLDAVSGLVLLGYPLHPPGKPLQLRARHLPAITKPMLFIQGSKDAFGTPAELQPVLTPLGSRAEVWIVEDGDHSFKVPKGATGRQSEVYAGIQTRIVDWIGEVAGRTI